MPGIPSPHGFDTWSRAAEAGAHETALIGTLAVGLSVAFVLGFVATRLRLPALVGYLLGGMLVGPFTPGFVADADLAPQLAEIGVILLMFGVGMHFAPADLWAVRRVALPGAIGQISSATALGMAAAAVWGWPLGQGLVFGLALSVASTVVLLRALEGRGGVQTEEGRIAVGWLLVEDLVTVIALVLLPALAGPLGGVDSGSDRPIWLTMLITLGKVTLFVVLMLVGGTRVVPRLLEIVDRTGSRELFILATLSLGLGIAYLSAEFFDVSFALGAFLAGVVVNESEFSHRAAEEALPLREAFAVLFFVSVGMLIDPSFLLDEAPRILVTLAIIVLGKAAAAVVLVRLTGGTRASALTVAAGLGQIGEFSFILAGVAVSLELLPGQGRDLILAGALLSITLNPLVWWVSDRFRARASEPVVAPGGQREPST